MKTKQDFLNALAGRRIDYDRLPQAFNCLGYWQRPDAGTGLIGIISADGCWVVYFFINTPCPQPITSAACFVYQSPAGLSVESIPDDVFNTAVSQILPYLLGANECPGVITVV